RRKYPPPVKSPLPSACFQCRHRFRDTGQARLTALCLLDPVTASLVPVDRSRDVVSVLVAPFCRWIERELDCETAARAAFNRRAESFHTRRVGIGLLDRSISRPRGTEQRVPAAVARGHCRHADRRGMEYSVA